MSKETRLLAIVYLAVTSWLLVTSVNGNKQLPKIEQHPNGIIVNVSDPVTLECRASGEPKPKITWYKDGQPLSIVMRNNDSPSSGGSSSTTKYTLIHESNLFIFSAMLGKGNKSDTGVYYCRADNEHGYAISQNANLIITYLKDDFREVPKSRQVNAGTTVSMECKAPKGLPEPTMWWEKGGAPVKPSKRLLIHSNGTLVVTNATLQDSGEYICVARNDAGYKYSPPASLSVFEKPSFVVEPTTASANAFVAGSRAELKCSATGYPKPQIEWKKDNSAENLPLSAQITDTHLSIASVHSDDEGEYTCVASNQLGTIESQPARLVVYERPTFIKHMANVTVGVATKSLTLECNAKGKPQPVIYWAKSAGSGAAVQQPATAMATQDDFIILENGDLFIERLSAKYEGTYLCQASNEHGTVEARTHVQVKPVQARPPPLVVYWPQNQTIPINTQANLECFAASPAAAVVAGVDNEADKNHEDESTSANSDLSGGYMQPSKETDRIVITWFKNNQLIKVDTASFDAKFRLLESGTLEINSVSKVDSGVYKCVASNSLGQTTSLPAYLNVEDPNNQYVEFERNYETTALPSAPSQPRVHKLTAKTLTLAWHASSHSGHSPVRAYTIEYYSPEWPRATAPGWQILAESPGSATEFLVTAGLVPDTYYMFVVRARNDQGHGPPSPTSDIVRTTSESASNGAASNNNNNNNINKNYSPEQLERALAGEVIQLTDPPQVLSSTSVNITWRILKSSHLITSLHIKYKPIGAKEYHSVTVNLSNRLQQSQVRSSSHVLTGLHKFTSYEFLVEPCAGAIRGSESNIVHVRTGEDAPSHAPNTVHVDVASLTSLAVKWQPPPATHMNGVIIGYRVTCVVASTNTNDSVKSSLNVNTNSTSRALVIANLAENVKYCVRVAAYTRAGVGPFSGPKCTETTAVNVLKSTAKTVADSSFVTKRLFSHRLFGEAWFLAALAVVTCVCLFLFIYLIWCLVCKRGGNDRNSGHKHAKYLSSSENCSLTLGGNALLQQQHLTKIDQLGNRYKLVNSNNNGDAIWLDTMHSGSNNSNPECCCVPDLHHNHHNHHHNHNNHQYLKQNCSSSSSGGANVQLIHDITAAASSTMDRKRMHNLSIKSKYNAGTASAINNNNMAASISSASTSSDSAAPQYAEIYAPLNHHHHQSNSAGSSTATTTTTSNTAANPYATSGLFAPGAVQHENSGNFYNLLNNSHLHPVSHRQMQTLLEQHVNNSNKYSSYTLSNSNSGMIGGHNHQQQQQIDAIDQKKLIKYLQSSAAAQSHSQQNTPRVNTKNHHRKNVDGTNNLEQQVLLALSQQQHQQLQAATLRNYHGHAGIVMPPMVPPPSLASALLAQQQQQQQQQIILDEYIANTLLSSHHQQAGCQQQGQNYSIPWSQAIGDPNLNSTNSNGNVVNSIQFLSRVLSPNSVSTLARGNSSCSGAQHQFNINSPNKINGGTFTAQQYLNRQGSQRQQFQLPVQQQQDYSSIGGADEDHDDDDMQLLAQFHQHQQQQMLLNNSKSQQQQQLQPKPQQQQQKASPSSYDECSNASGSQTHQDTHSTSFLSSSKRSSKCGAGGSGGSGSDALLDHDDSTASKKLLNSSDSNNQHYANAGDDELENVDVTSGKATKPELFISEMPQTIL